MNRAAQIEAARREVERARKAWDATQTVPLGDKKQISLGQAAQSALQLDDRRMLTEYEMTVVRRTRTMTTFEATVENWRRVQDSFEFYGQGGETEPGFRRASKAAAEKIAKEIACADRLL